MKISFTVDEVFEIAVQIERNGVAFYRKAAQNAGNAAAAALFRSLAEQEGEHATTFSEMRASLIPEESRISVYDKDEIVAIHLQALAGQQVFKMGDASVGLRGNETIGEILKIAVAMERDSIVFYAAVRNLMHADRDGVDEIIRQEQKHVDDLTALLSSVAGNE